jgi:hypothetical protein
MFRSAGGFWILLLTVRLQRCWPAGSFLAKFEIFGERAFERYLSENQMFLILSELPRSDIFVESTMQ